MDPIGKKLLEVAQAELGYTETSDGYTKYGDWYSKNVEDDSYFATAPWCDMFLAWAANKAGVQDSVGEFAYTPSHAKWFKKQDAWGQTPEPGALVFYAWSGSKDLDDIGHVGLVEKVNGRTLHTIEANADGMYLKRKTRDVSNVVGYGYPSKVQVAAPAPAAVPTAAPLPLTSAVTSVDKPAPSLMAQESVLTAAVGVALIGTAAIAIGRSRLAGVSPLRLRKRGRHHRTATPVALPVGLAPHEFVADLASAEAGTVVMPALTAAAATQAEDREFWGRIAHLEEDEELRFWDDLHAAVADSPLPLVSRSLG